MRLWSLLALALLLLGVLGAYHVMSLERRIDALASRLGPAPSAPASDKTNPALEPRLASAENEITALRKDITRLETELERVHAAAVVGQPGVEPLGADKGASEDRILSVVGKAQNRVRDAQLKFQRDRWLEWRESELDAFAQAVGLSAWQVEQIHNLLADEIDSMVELLRRPELIEHPEQAAKEWDARLELTDKGAHNVLEPAQVAAWDQARLAERKTLWPWLSNNKAEQ